MTFEQLTRQRKTAGSRLMAATVGQKMSEIRKQSIKDAFVDFNSMKHRCEHISTVNDVDYYDDSAAVSTSATWFSFENIGRPVVWIAGDGIDNVDYEELIPMVKRYVKAIVCVGDNVASLHSAFDNLMQGKIFDAKNIAEAVVKASGLASNNVEAVLFSPGCDVGESYCDCSERASCFKDNVMKLNNI